MKSLPRLVVPLSRNESTSPDSPSQHKNTFHLPNNAHRKSILKIPKEIEAKETKEYSESVKKTARKILFKVKMYIMFNKSKKIVQSHVKAFLLL